MDLWISPPKVDGMGAMMWQLSTGSLSVVFSASPIVCTYEVATGLFYRNIVKYFGIPFDIVSDCDVRFTDRFWIVMFGLMRIRLKFSMTNHQQTDRQTKRINALLEEYLRHYVTMTQLNWLELLDNAKFCYNLHISSTTESSPFELVLRVQPQTPAEIAL